MTLAQQDPHLASLLAEIKAAEAALAARLADLHVYIGQGDRTASPVLIAVAGPEKRTDLLGKEWIEAGAAASRFRVSKDTVWRWCKNDPEWGWLRGGRWFVSISRVRAKLNIR
jgi:hypothetical protein